MGKSEVAPVMVLISEGVLADSPFASGLIVRPDLPSAAASSGGPCSVARSVAAGH